MCPFIQEKKEENPDVDFSTIEEFQRFHIWSEEFSEYEHLVRKSEEENLAPVIEYF